MFGAVIFTAWAITYVNKKKTVYYLAVIDDASTKIVWSTKKDNAKRFVSEADALICIDKIQKVRNNKKKDLKVVQV